MKRPWITVTVHFFEQPVLSYGGAQYDPADEEARPLIEAQGGEVALRGGYIYLQSEGHPVEFRNVEIMPLE